ncbi:hypothetical protein ACH9L7_11250 [Haloferax sp. S1W]|uniref:hypothetical protein n=1 Tax=Haloferax sp. S1W TaxID=3377110 RepID=UPI0037CBE72F
MSMEKNTQTPLATEDTYTGMIYWIAVPDGYKINKQNLREHLNDRIFTEDITESVEEGTEIPDVFKQDGRIVQRTSVENAKAVSTPYGEVIVADIQMDDRGTVTYRGDKILTMDAADARLLVFDTDGVYYLIVVSRRSVAQAVTQMLRRQYSQLGPSISDTRLDHRSLKQIQEDLDAGLMDTIISDFPQEELTNIEIRGRGFENNPDYERHQSKGQLQNHMFQTEKLVPGKEKTIRIANDGLVRIYSKARLDTYLRLLTEFVLPNIHRDRKGESSLKTFENPDGNSIFERERD